MFSKKTTKIDEIFTLNLTFTTYCQIVAEDFVNFCGFLKKRELYVLCVKSVVKIWSIFVAFLENTNFIRAQFCRIHSTSLTSNVRSVRSKL